jgi:hypothetical protein
MLAPLIPRVPYVMPAITITTPLVLPDTPCPVNDKNRDTWTEFQRYEAENNRVIAQDVDHLEKLVSTL